MTDNTKTKMIILRTRFPAGDYMQATKTPAKRGTTYDYFYVTNGDEKVEAGMFAVVDVAPSSHGEGGMKVVQIESILTRSTNATKHALTVFSLEGYQARLDLQERITSLRAEILDRAETARERARLDELAKSDEGLASLLAELDELQNG